MAFTSPAIVGDDLDAYRSRLQSPHDCDIEVDILTMSEKHVASVGHRLLDGQVNIQRDATVKRTATFSLFDPDNEIGFDSGSAFGGALFADRMVRATHSLEVPGVGVVRAIPFVGPVVKVARDGDVLNIEAQDKTLLAIEGRPPKTVKKGQNAVEAIREIMSERTGEARFRFPANNRKRLARSYSVGWKTEASPWAVCQKIARSIGMQLVYACDGALLLRDHPKAVAFDFADGGALTGAPQTDYDLTNLRNYVRVTGEKKKTNPADAEPPAKHALSPKSLGRNGVKRYLPLLVDDSGIKKQRVAQRRANDELAALLPISITASFPAVPVFHLDYGDHVRVTSQYGDAVVPFVEASIPLGVGGDASFGTQRRVSQKRRSF